MCGYTPTNLGKIIKEGVMSDVPSIHRMTIDAASMKKHRMKNMRTIEFISPEDITVKNYEVLSVSKIGKCIDIWPGDILCITIWGDRMYEGKIVWSIDPGCICLEYKERCSWKIPQEYIKQIEILEYSPVRPNEEVDNDYLLKV